MNRYAVIGIIGVVSGLLCALADVPLEKNCRERRIKPRLKGLEPWWAEVPEGRFGLSFWLSFLGQPGTYLTMWMLAELIARRGPGLGLALKINTFIGAYTGLMCHAVFCLKPMLYQRIQDRMSAEEARRTLAVVDRCALAPMALGFASLWLGTTGLVTAAIFSGALAVPAAFALLNPVVAAALLLALKRAGARIPGPLGVGFSLFAVTLLVAGLGV